MNLIIDLDITLVPLQQSDPETYLRSQMITEPPVRTPCQQSRHEIILEFELLEVSPDGSR